ncbi:MAG: hypothetical protein LBT59_17650 [Clostridiales bacterium]|jgi:cellulose biosynthesis protein BcsQ|nr:hypothetical protein [Clostridiales bacterium]
MKIQLLIASSDKDYTEHLSGTLAEKHAESFEISVCSEIDRIEPLLSARTYDVALIDPEFSLAAGLNKARSVLLLWDEFSSFGGGDYPKIRKYQRISRIGSDILEEYSKSSIGRSGFGYSKGKITAVWSAGGGVGKTSTALAYAAQKAVIGVKITYLDLECFSSTSIYFPDSGKSISTVFERLDSNVSLLLKAIAVKDASSGINYFSPPNNYDDMNELNADDIESLIQAASENFEEVVVDLPCMCDERCRKVFEAAEQIFIVSDGSKSVSTKLAQFMTQHNLFERVKDKAVLVANKGAKINDPRFSRVVSLPLVPSNDPVSTYKTLSGVRFN